MDYISRKLLSASELYHKQILKSYLKRYNGRMIESDTCKSEDEFSICLNKLMDNLDEENYFLRANLEKIKEYIELGKTPPYHLVDYAFKSFTYDFLGIDHQIKYGFEEGFFRLDDSFETLALQSILGFELMYLQERLSPDSNKEKIDFQKCMSEHVRIQLEKIGRGYNKIPIKEAIEDYDSGNNIEKLARNSIHIFLVTYEGKYKPYKSIFEGLIKQIYPKISKNDFERISCGLLSIYTSYKTKNKIISDYEYVRNALAHPSYSISNGIMYIDVIENDKKINEIEIPCNDFIRWPVNLIKKIKGLITVFQLNNMVAYYLSK